MTPTRPAAAEEWTAQECAQHIGTTPGTWRSYTARGQAPSPVRHVGRTPVWDADQVRAWAATRPGRGRWGPRTRPTTQD